MPRRKAIKYKRNPPIRGDARDGDLVQDDITGAWTRERRLVTDYEGYRVDPRLGGLDYPDHKR
jgi:hypothetical protein